MLFRKQILRCALLSSYDPNHQSRFLISIRHETAAIRIGRQHLNTNEPTHRFVSKMIKVCKIAHGSSTQLLLRIDSDEQLLMSTQ
jgi:hypothetical protein